MKYTIKRLLMTIASVGMLAIYGCGGGGGGSVTAVPSSPSVAKTFSMDTIKSGSAADPLAVIRSTNGSTIAYFGAATGSTPTQAQFKSTSGVAQTTYFDTAGLITKIVDNNNGNFVILHPRSDGAGMEYVAFDVTGKFINGFALFARNGVWSSAQILGLPADAGVVNYGAAVYGPVTALNSNLSAVLTPAGLVVAMKQSPFIRVLNGLIPSAHAFSLVELANLTSGAVLMVVGTLAGGRTNPLGIGLMVGGTVQIYRGLSGQVQRALDTLSAVTDSLFTGREVNPIYEGKDFLESGTTVVNDIESGNAQPVPANVDAFISRNDVQASQTSGTPQLRVDTSTPTLQMKTTTTTSSMPVPALTAIVISKVAPAIASINVPVNIVVTGTNLGGWTGLSVKLDGCTGMTQRGGTDTSKTFTCTPGLAGLRAGTVSNGSTSVSLNTFYVTVADVVTPVVSAVSPLTATQGQLATFSIAGKDLLNGMVFSLASCNGIVEISNGTTSVRQFTCTPAVSGPLAGTVRDKPNGTTLKSFTVTVSSAPVVVTAPVITLISPTTAVMNTPTLFTATGSNLTNGMDAVIVGCTNYLPATGLTTGTSTQQQFTCTPTILGNQRGYWNAAGTSSTGGGQLVSTFYVDVQQGKTTNTTCVTGKQAVLQNYYSSVWHEYVNYCYYIDSSGKEVFHGKLEEYASWNTALPLIKLTYVDGFPVGPAQHYVISPISGAAQLLDEGNYAKVLMDGVWQSVFDGTWKTYFVDANGLGSIGKLQEEITFGTVLGIPRQVIAGKVYCSLNGVYKLAGEYVKNPDGGMTLNYFDRCY